MGTNNYNDGDDKHDLFWELDAFDPKWQTRYRTLREAAQAANCLPDYYAYMNTAEGLQYRIRWQDVPDTVAQNAAQRQLRERMAGYGKKLGERLADFRETDND